MVVLMSKESPIVITSMLFIRRSIVFGREYSFFGSVLVNSLKTEVRNFGYKQSSRQGGSRQPRPDSKPTRSSSWLSAFASCVPGPQYLQECFGECLGLCLGSHFWKFRRASCSHPDYLVLSCCGSGF